MSRLKVIISGGGTGGHIFPALAVAGALRELNKENEILFVGARGKMEMEKVSQHGFQIVGLPIRGIQRSLKLTNIKVPFLLLHGIWISIGLIREFKPDVVVGFGGYASAAVVFAARIMGRKTMIQEQNSYPGITNRILSKIVDRICVAFEGMNKFFPDSKIILTGNPIRKDLLNKSTNVSEARDFFGIDRDKLTILAIGGSLGAGTVNKCMRIIAPKLKDWNAQLIWQSGKAQYHELKGFVDSGQFKEVNLSQFIERMDLAYASADIVISRAGALSISEITLLQKPSILIPSPNVAEDHQTINAISLTQMNAAILIKDDEAEKTIEHTLKELIGNQTKLEGIKSNIKKVYSNENAADDIAEEINKLARTDV